jgi:predicted AAA+ superfamily ATPase
VKSPKFYFLDTGLAARLQGHLDAAVMMKSPQAGHLFETLVLGEIVKTRDHNGFDWQLFFWRTRDGEEYDFVVASRDKVIVLDAQIAIQAAQPISASNGLRAAFKESRDTFPLGKVIQLLKRLNLEIHLETRKSE